MAKFGPGDVVRLIDDTAMSAEQGATAVVYGTERFLGGRPLTEVFWLDGKANHQNNGGYYEDDLELVQECSQAAVYYKDNRVKVIDDSIENLRDAVEKVREDGHEVSITLTRKVSEEI